MDTWLDPEIDLHPAGYVVWCAAPPPRVSFADHVKDFRLAIMEATNFLFTHAKWQSEAMKHHHELELVVGHHFVRLFQLIPQDFTFITDAESVTFQKQSSQAGPFVGLFGQIPVWESAEIPTDQAVLRDGHNRYVKLALSACRWIDADQPKPSIVP
jgi:hypothetical protein